jgi:hypothetical protein
MNAFKKTVLAVATASSLVMAAAPAQASPLQWIGPNGNNFGNGLAVGVGLGVGLGITNNLLAPRPNTVIIQQPTCRTVLVRNQFGQLVHATAC